MSKSHFTVFVPVLVVIILAIAMMPAVQARIAPEKDLLIFIDGDQVLFPDEQPYIDETGHTMVPARFLAECLNASLEWNSNAGQLKISAGESSSFAFTSMILTVGQKSVDILPARYEEMDTVPVVKNDRVMVPLRFICNNMDCDTEWDNTGRIVHIFTQNQNEAAKKDIINNSRSLAMALPRVNSETRLQELLEESNSSRLLRTVNDKEKSIFQETNMLSSAADEAADYSGTNVQVDGVDEADIVKCDGEYIYQVKNHEVIIIKAYPADTMAVTARIPITAMPRDIFIDSNRLVLISDLYDDCFYPLYEKDIAAEATVKLMPPYYGPRGGLEISVYDISDKSRPVKLDSYKMEGNYINSRKINNNLYFISNQYIYEPYKPVYYINEQAVETPYTDIRYFPDIKHNSYLHIAHLNLNGNADFSVETYLGSGSEIYCSSENLYVTATEYTPYHDYEYYMPAESTVIFKFNLDEGVNYNARGIVEGRLLNQFSMDEYNNCFRIATTSDQWSDNSSSAIFILDSKLQPLGAIKDIAPGERIYSARFMDNKAYLVTFKEMDPFFVLDLNPDNPKVLGKLKIPGFSDYLHPYGDNCVLGLGYDTWTTKNGGVRQGGIKIALFDVSDVNNPVEIDKHIIGTAGSQSAACDNHHAFLLYNNILAFPATVYEADNPNDSYESFDFQGAYIFEVSPQGFNYEGRITHLDDEDYLKAGDYWSNSPDNIRRILYLGGNLYTISDDCIKASSASNLKEIKSISTAR